MQNDDNDAEVPLGVTPPEGLGHDPLEWLQEDEEDSVAEALSEQPGETPQVPSVAESAPEPEANEMTAQDADEATNAEVEANQNQSVTPVDNGNQSLTIDNHKAIIRLPEKLSVQIVEPLHTEWKSLFYDLPQSLEIDATDVKDVDAAGMQLLYLLVQQMSFKGCDVVVINVNNHLQRYVKVAGLEEFFTQFVHAA